MEKTERKGRDGEIEKKKTGTNTYMKTYGK